MLLNSCILVLKEKIDRGVEIMKQVDDTLKTIQKFKTQIENDRESIFTAVIKTQDEWGVLYNKVDKIRSDYESSDTKIN